MTGCTIRTWRRRASIRSRTSSTFGWHEGRNPNALFDTAGYLAHYADVAAAGVNPLEHYNTFGWHEGRDPSVGFDTSSYLAAYPDVAAAQVNPLEHFLQFGVHDQRRALRARVATAGIAIKRQHGGEKISQRRRIGELRRDARIDRAGREEHQAEMPERVQQQDRQQDGARLGARRSFGSR